MGSEEEGWTDQRLPLMRTHASSSSFVMSTPRPQPTQKGLDRVNPLARITSCSID